MEISIEAIIGLITVLSGGTCIGGFFFWKQTKRRATAEAALAEAEAKIKEAEAKKAEIEAAKERQDYYQQLVKDLADDREDRKRQNDELRNERDYYKNECVKLQEQIDKLQKSIFEWKNLAEEDRAEMKRQISRMGRKVDAMTPFMCGDLACKLRQRVTISDEGIVKPKKGKKAEIEPSNEEL